MMLGILLVNLGKRWTNFETCILNTLQPASPLIPLRVYVSSTSPKRQARFIASFASLCAHRVNMCKKHFLSCLWVVHHRPSALDVVLAENRLVGYLTDGWLPGVMALYEGLSPLHWGSDTIPHLVYQALVSADILSMRRLTEVAGGVGQSTLFLTMNCVRGGVWASGLVRERGALGDDHVVLGVDLQVFGL